MIARVDLLSDAAGEPVLLELEAIEPALYFAQAPRPPRGLRAPRSAIRCQRALDQVGERSAQSAQPLDVVLGQARGDHRADRRDERLAREALGRAPGPEELREQGDEQLLCLGAAPEGPGPAA